MWERTLQAAELPEMVEMLLTNDEEGQRRVTMRFREWISEGDPRISTIVETGTVRRFVEFLSMNCSRALKMDAAWILTNIAAGTSEDTKTVVDAGAVPVFIELLNSKFENLREQAVWALGNIAADCPKYRNIILDHGIMDPLLRMLNEPNIIKNAVWTLKSLCRSKSSPPDFATVSRSLPILANLLFHYDYSVLSDACWTISYLADGPNDHVQCVIDAGVCKRLVELLMHFSPNVSAAALRAVGNIVSGDDNQTQVLLNFSPLPGLLHLLIKGWESVKKECCWTISNITAGTQSQIQEVIDANIIPKVIEILNTEPNYKIKREAAWVITNISFGGSAEQIKFLAENGCIKIFCNLLAEAGCEIIPMLLDSLRKILFCGEEDAKNNGWINCYIAKIKEFSGYERLLNLHSDYTKCDCHKIAKNILKTYFEDKKSTTSEQVRFEYQFVIEDVD